MVQRGEVCQQFASDIPKNYVSKKRDNANNYAKKTRNYKSVTKTFKNYRSKKKRFSKKDSYNLKKKAFRERKSKSEASCYKSTKRWALCL